MVTAMILTREIACQRTLESDDRELSVGRAQTDWGWNPFLRTCSYSSTCHELVCFLMILAS